MTKRTVRALAFVFLAAPLLLMGCGDSDNKGGTGGSGAGTGGAIRYDGGGGTGGSNLDVGVTPDTLPPAVDTVVADTAPAVDVVVPVDTTIVADAAIPDAPILLDAPILFDTNAIDVATPVDVTIPVDTTTAIDATPVCTMTTPFTGGDVTENLTLTKACSPYTIAHDLQVTANAILTIEEGVTLKFESGVALNVGTRDNAGLVAVGTAAAPITFTSAVAVPSAGDWIGIYFDSNVMAGTKIAYAKADYCGSEGYACVHTAGSVKTGRVTLDHLIIDHVGTGSNGITEEDAATSLAITNSTFSNIPTQQYAIAVQAPSFAGIGDTNTFNGALIQINGGDITSTTSWVDPGTDVAVTNQVNVGGTTSPVLTIGPGLTLKFGADVEMDIGSSSVGVGQLVVAGTAAKHVTFTALAATPSPGSWYGLFIDYGAKAQISYADFSYGGGYGGDNKGNLVFYEPSSTASLKVDNSKFTYSLGYGIELDCTDTTPLPTLNLTNNTYAHNGSDTTDANTEAANVGPGLSCLP